MRILLDECLPKDLARELSGHEVKTVPQAGWASVSNGKLLRQIADSGQFDLFLTVDKRLPEQNKTSSLPFAIVLLRAKSNRMIHVLPFAAEILSRLDEFKAGRTYVLTLPE
jgi:predicted nuclease of predicted toxin-antitoxin system